VIIRPQHVLSAGLCVWGLRAWCRANGVDLRQMCRDGVALDAHPALVSDPLVQRVVAAAEQEARNA
jgi:hypothetical protein